MIEEVKGKDVSASMIMSRSEGSGDPVRQRSGWLIPAGVFAVTAALSAMMLLFYLAPTPRSFIEQHPSPTSRANSVAMDINGANFAIPENYILYKSARRNGSRKEISLVTVYPAFRGYNDEDAQSFAANAADSPFVYFLVREERLNITEQERLERVYLNLVVNRAGKLSRFGLTEYAFRDDSGYRGEDLFVGGSVDAPVVMRCDRFTRQMRSPYCFRDMRFSHRFAVNYRFKRALLADWRPIADGVSNLVISFRNRAK